MSLYSELDIASHGDTVEETRNNLHESLELSFECGLSAEFEQRPCGELFVTQVAVKC